MDTIQREIMVKQFEEKMLDDEKNHKKVTTNVNYHKTQEQGQVLECPNDEHIQQFIKL